MNRRLISRILAGLSLAARRQDRDRHGPFVGNFRFEREKFIDEPFLSPDGRKLFFVADLPLPPTSMYFASTRTDSGKVATDGKIYRAALLNGKYATAELLPGLVNREDAGDPCIAPDESHLVFSSWRKGGYGGTGLYLSRRGANGDWSQPINLGPTINTPFEEVGPRISSDGKCLFSHRRDKWQNATSSDIY
jgi:Tol biopolymer transport system component